MDNIQVRRTFSVLIFFLGLSLILYPYVAQYINNLSASKMVQDYFAAEAPVSDRLAFGAESQDTESAASFDEDIFGSISIPSLNLELPIFTGPTTENLSKGIAHLEGSSLPVGGKSTHSVLCGHNGNVVNEWFTRIDQLTEGDLFFIQTREQRLTYKVISMKIIAPNDTSDLFIREGQDLVTLLTCADSGTMRLIVTGERVPDDI